MQSNIVEHCRTLHSDMFLGIRAVDTELGISERRRSRDSEAYVVLVYFSTAGLLRRAAGRLDWLGRYP